MKGDYLSVVNQTTRFTVRNICNMLSSTILSGLLMISGQNVDFPKVWKKIDCVSIGGYDYQWFKGYYYGPPERFR